LQNLEIRVEELANSINHHFSTPLYQSFPVG